eukprot:TRINITY_DN12811_c0_g1_i1.p1 TRINITY_DN12811_c0_g1~~TRINITY_DN12811_c0_g1_i1.p1  ORF type:complete len:139 (+),score=7.13 TRINITY_DN12811_c0_g1_i1:125-541(+)
MNIYCEAVICFGFISVLIINLADYDDVGTYSWVLVLTVLSALVLCLVITVPEVIKAMSNGVADFFKKIRGSKDESSKSGIAIKIAAKDNSGAKNKRASTAGRNHNLKGHVKNYTNPSYRMVMKAINCRLIPGLNGISK